MTTEIAVTTIAHAIQLAVAPVFLLTGVASILSVLTTRLGRIIDRSRLLNGRLMQDEQADLAVQAELKSLTQRARLIHWAIGLCTLCLLLICAVVGVLFLGAFFKINLPVVIATLFVGAMLTLCVALLNFIGEIFLATAHVRSGH